MGLGHDNCEDGYGYKINSLLLCGAIYAQITHAG